MHHFPQLVIPDELRIPQGLYHSTSQSGLLGILSTKTLWATRIQYLNDSTEFAYALGLLKNSVYLLRLNAHPESKFAIALDAIYKALESLSGIHIHVGCFSEKSDDLSQWRGYCPDGIGYSIGFEPLQLVAAATRQCAILAPCIYDYNRQTELIGRLLATGND